LPLFLYLEKDFKQENVNAIKNKYFLITILALIGWVSFSQEVNAQSQKRVIQLSGIVMDTVTGPIPGVHVYIPKAGRGVTTNTVGFFSLPVLVGDSIIISSVGYKRQHYIVPPTATEFFTIIVPMVEDVTYLKEIVIVPYPTEEVFKEAVLALNLPPDNMIDQKNLNAARPDFENHSDGWPDESTICLESMGSHAERQVHAGDKPIPEPVQLGEILQWTEEEKVIELTRKKIFYF
jgi:hypothetical protein